MYTILQARPFICGKCLKWIKNWINPAILGNKTGHFARTVSHKTKMSIPLDDFLKMKIE